jgi:hypothetical protein
MAEDDPEAALLIRAGGRTIHPSPDDIAQIREAIEIVTETFESLIEVVTDERTAEGLRTGGNGEMQRLAPGDLQEIGGDLSKALTAFSGDELNIDSLEQISADLAHYAFEAREHFEGRSKQFSPRPADQGEPIAVAGVLFAGLSDAAGALEQLLGLLEEVVKQSENRV